ncbi:hypothetical protein PV367_35435 [Streptomyces europaeiscabiei]|uniref:Uncharacterized protein n=1 Tax=Streptomyces europaeiscabiei TaxID=146819 RepID=A0AAJ2UQY0_9ACTN|nr:hypothetical protein [Streptomyces europaeiscabiei]MDX3134966.1 hypothetical protein [Streptomyces europaeiscabiei]
MTAALTEYDDFFRFLPPARPGSIRRRPHGPAGPPPAPAVRGVRGVRGGCGRAVYGGLR